MEAKIPSLEEWIQLSIQLNLPQLLEIKLHGGETPIWCRDCLRCSISWGDGVLHLPHAQQRGGRRAEAPAPKLVVGFIVPINFGGVPKVEADFLVVEQQSYSHQFNNRRGRPVTT